MTKKLLVILLAISIALSFSACGGDKNNSDSSTAEVTATTASETTITTEKPIEFEITDWKFTDISHLPEQVPEDLTWDVYEDERKLQTSNSE